MNSFRGCQQIQAERLGNFIVDRLTGCLDIDAHPAVGNLSRPNVSEDHVGVGNGRLGTAKLIASGTGNSTCAARTNVQASGFVYRCDAATAGTYLGDVDAWGA